MELLFYLRKIWNLKSLVILILFFLIWSTFFIELNSVFQVVKDHLETWKLDPPRIIMYFSLINLISISFVVVLIDRWKKLKFQLNNFKIRNSYYYSIIISCLVILLISIIFYYLVAYFVLSNFNTSYTKRWFYYFMINCTFLYFISILISFKFKIIYSAFLFPIYFILLLIFISGSGIYPTFYQYRNIIIGSEGLFLFLLIIILLIDYLVGRYKDNN